MVWLLMGCSLTFPRIWPFHNLIDLKRPELIFKAVCSKCEPFDQGDFGHRLRGLRAVVATHHKREPTTPVGKTARPLFR